MLAISAEDAHWPTKWKLSYTTLEESNIILSMFVDVCWTNYMVGTSGILCLSFSIVKYSVIPCFWRSFTWIRRGDKMSRPFAHHLTSFCSCCPPKSKAVGRRVRLWVGQNFFCLFLCIKQTFNVNNYCQTNVKGVVALTYISLFFTKIILKK